MELVTGRRPTDFEFNEMEDKKVGAYSLIKLVESRVKLNDINDIVDQALKIEFDSNEEESIADILNISLECTQDNPGYRPTMEEIIIKLNSMPH